MIFLVFLDTLLWLGRGSQLHEFWPLIGYNLATELNTELFNGFSKWLLFYLPLLGGTPMTFVDSHFYRA